VTPGGDEALTLDLPLAAACRGEGVRTVVQPIVDIRRGRVAGYEALTRFDLVDGVTPDRWFAAAAETGCTARLEAATLRSALARRADIPGNCFLTVNVEPASLMDAGVTGLFAEAGDLRGLVIELTEHRPIDFVAIGPALRVLRNAGARIAMDDAGAGYAGLSQILSLRPDFLKLDRSLVTDLDDDLAKAGLVEMIGVFADRIDAWVIAEGIETESELDRLADLAVPLGQGWVIGRPADEWTTPVLSPRDRDVPTAPLRRLVHRPPTAPLGDREALVGLLGAGTAPSVVVVDGDGAPVGVVGATGATAGTLVSPLWVNVADELHSVARRVAVRGTNDDVVVVDDAGRLVGAVSVARLLSALADEVDPARRPPVASAES
jgi:EAL domain-containing protein (putative c-di-GMP-specific phosphodiesterase class I)